MALTTLGATALSAGIGAAGGIIGSTASGLFGANQARKNRAFQERMYNKQVEDNIKFWNMQNEYNLPSAQLQRLRDAGLNPLLMYGEGGISGNLAQQAPQSAQAPHGAQGSASIHTPIDFANLALMKEQINLLKSEQEKNYKESDKIASETDWQNIENKFNQETYNIRKAIQFGNWDYLKTQMDQMRNDIYNSRQITTQQVLSMIQGRQYEIKRFNLDFDTQGSYIAQGWKRLQNETTQVSQGWRSLAIQFGHLQNETRMTTAQIGAIQWNLLKDMSFFGEQFRSLKLDNKLKAWDVLLKRAGLAKTQVEVFNGMLKNYYLYNTGTEQIGSAFTDMPRTLWQGSNKPDFQDMFVIPWFNNKFQPNWSGTK